MIPRLSSSLRLYCDGASRGNPGPAAMAFKILDEDGAVVKKSYEFLGKRTNNEAEYEALVAALESASRLTSGQVDCFLDSELVVRQLNGEYRIRSPRLKGLWLKVRETQRCFQNVSFTYVPRTDKNIEEVDELANSVLNRIVG